VGYYYPPPPVSIGGAQPYAPRLGIAQSGPVPQAPPQRGSIALATLGVILASWQPPFFVAQGAGDIAPTIPAPAVANPPLMQNRAIQTILQSSWQADPTTVVSLCSVAAFATPPVISQPPAVTGVNLQTILQTWQQPAFLVQGAGDIAPTLPAPVVSQPPVQSGTNLRVIRCSWEPPFFSRKALATSRRRCRLFRSRSQFQQRCCIRYGPPGIRLGSLPICREPGDIAPTLPASSQPSQPPVLTSVNLQTILQAWQPPFVMPPGANDIAPMLPAPIGPSQPPVPTSVNFETVLQSWLPGFVLPQRSQSIATQPIVNAPPAVTGAQYASLIALNQPAPYALPEAGTVASWLPPAGAPSQPQPVSYATLNLIVRAWDPPVWWPLPDNGPIAQIATVVNAPPARVLAQFYALVAASQPTFVLPPTGEDFAPLIATPAQSALPPPSSANLRLLLQSWDVVPVTQQRRTAVTASGPLPDQPPPLSRVNIQTLVQMHQLPWNYGQGFGRIAGYPILLPLTGTPRYVVRRQQKRMFTVSSVTYSQFPPKDTAEAVKLEFDFSPDLDSGVLLSGTPVVTVTMSSGADPTPASILNGMPRFDVTSTQVIVPVMGGVANCDYDVKVVVPTTDSLTVLALSGILPVRA
jgi:hypothetical protein